MTAEQAGEAPLGGLWAVRVGGTFPIGMLHLAAAKLAELHLDDACQAVCDLAEEIVAIDGRIEGLAPVLDALERHLLVKANVTLDQLTRAEREWSQEARFRAVAGEQEDQ